MKTGKKKPRFLRKDTFKLSRLGKRRKKKQKWRRARGIHNKIRRKEKGYGKEPRIGYSAARETRGYVFNLKPVLIRNISDLEKASDNCIIIISRRIGKKKRQEIMKKVEERKLKLKKY